MTYPKTPKIPFDHRAILNVLRFSLFSGERDPMENEGAVEKLSQAQRVLRLFGGARKLASLLLIVGKPRDPSNLYRWTYSREKGGTGGLVPTSAWADILLAARLEGIIVPVELMHPEHFTPIKTYKQDDRWS